MSEIGIGFVLSILICWGALSPRLRHGENRAAMEGWYSAGFVVGPAVAAPAIQCSSARQIPWGMALSRVCEIDVAASRGSEENGRNLSVHRCSDLAAALEAGVSGLLSAVKRRRILAQGGAAGATLGHQVIQGAEPCKGEGNVPFPSPLQSFAGRGIGLSTQGCACGSTLGYFPPPLRGFPIERQFDRQPAAQSPSSTLVITSCTSTSMSRTH
jgi:hypothetical protein